MSNKVKRRSKIGTRRVTRSVAGDTVNAIVLIIFGAFMFIPMLYTINNAFKPLDELFIFPPRIFVKNPTLDNFADLSMIMGESWVPFSRYIFNTFFITIVATVGHVIFSSMAAYAFEKHRFKGRNFCFKLVVTTLLFSGSLTSIPSYIIMTKLGWVDSFMALIIPAIGAPLGLYLMKQAMCSIPDSLIEAAKIDGSSEWHTFWRIVMPNQKPAWLTLVIFSFQSLWGITGGTFIFSEEKKTLSYTMSQVVSGGIARAGAGAAVGVFMMIVPIAVFILTQSNIMETMTTSGMKD